MKLLGTLYSKGIGKDNEVLIGFSCDDYQSKEDAYSLNSGTQYVIDIKKNVSKRSLKQNNLLWALIGEISQKENGNASKENTVSIYKNLLKASGVGCEFFECTPEAYKSLSTLFRVCTIVQERTREKNGEEIKTVMCQGFRGSSTFDKEEMKVLIDKTLEYAASIGINADAWKYEFYGEE